jgi:hypothetical protein
MSAKFAFKQEHPFGARRRARSTARARDARDRARPRGGHARDDLIRDDDDASRARRDARRGRDGARGTTSIVRVAGRRRASRARRDARRGRGRWVSTVARFKRETRRDETRRDDEGARTTRD